MSNATEALESRIHDLTVEPGTVACVWLGQAGYILKAPSGTIVMIDPYLSDWAEEQWNMARIVEAPVDPATFQPDLLLISHWHEDHLDAPTIKRWANDGIEAVFVGPDTCSSRAAAWGWNAEDVITLTEFDEVEIEDIIIRPTFARHESREAPPGDAFGFLVDIGGVRIWYAGDTEYDARLRPMKDEAIDVALIPINGVGGNLDAEEAALLIYKVAPKTAVPMHYNMWTSETFGPVRRSIPSSSSTPFRSSAAAPKCEYWRLEKIVTFSS